MKYKRMANTLLAAMLGMLATHVAANEAHAPAAPAAAHKPAAAPAAHGEAAPTAKAQAAHTETLQPSIHPLRKLSIKPATPVHVASGHAAPRKASAHGTAAKHKPAAAHGSSAGHDDHDHGSEIGKVQGLVKAMLAANSNYMKRNNSAYFDKFASKQTPRATVVTCADSRVQSNAFHGDAVNDLFMVRNMATSWPPRKVRSSTACGTSTRHY